MLADGVVTQGAKAWAAMVLTWLCRNILGSAPQGLTLYHLSKVVIYFLNVNFLKDDLQLLSDNMEEYL